MLFTEVKSLIISLNPNLLPFSFGECNISLQKSLNQILI